MSFDSSVITEVFPPSWQGGRLALSWMASSPAGTYFQVYVQGSLAWYGQATHAVVDAPAGQIQIDIGAVGPGEQTTNFSGSLSPIQTRAFLTWKAFGAAGFRIYAGTANAAYDGPAYDAGGYDGAVSYSTPIADITALEQGLSTDGYDAGTYDQGGYDEQGGSYSWESAPLTRGVWNFAVVSYDAAGNEGAPITTSVPINCPPSPPAKDTLGRRLEYTYSPLTHRATLTWLASPG